MMLIIIAMYGNILYEQEDFPNVVYVFHGVCTEDRQPGIHTAFNKAFMCTKANS